MRTGKVPESSQKPHYHGHRERLRQRFAETDGNGMPDYEILELLLALAIPRGDVKPVAKALMDRFGSLGDVLSAESEALIQIKGIGDSAATALKVVRAAGLRLSRQQITKRDVIGSWDQLLAYCKAAMGYQKIEQLRILFLDRKNVLIADEVQQQGTVDHTPLYPREVVKRALELGASAIILVHNHPSGDPTPSRADIEMTRQVKDICEKLGIALHDHVIIGRGRHASFQGLGLL
ncbi:MAG: DNA repair protein RadC [Proteobacteria bacterium]|nr:DNA repair protein RadC [Pseudomonadota bacterium]